MERDLMRAVRALGALGLDYLKWTQLVPMLTAWAFLLLCIGLLALVNFQDEGFALVDGAAGLWQRFPWLPDLSGAVATGEDGSLSLDGEGFRDVVIRGWAGLSLALFLLGQALRPIVGPGRPSALRRKLVALVVALIAAWTAMVLIFLFGREIFHGPAWQWYLMFSATCFLVGLVSLYSLSVSALLDLMSQALRVEQDSDVASSPTPPPIAP